MGALFLNAVLKAQLAFVREHGTRLPALFDGATADVELLAPLDRLIAEAEIVALGELNHFVHEKSDFRLFFARYLVSRGWRNFAEELGWSDGVRVDRFVASGNSEELERLPSFGSFSHLRADRDDRPSGILRTGHDAYPKDLFRAEQGRFYRALRQASPELRYFGFDIDGLPGGSYEDIGARLAEFADLPEIRTFLAALARVPGESASAEAERLRGLLARCTALPLPHAAAQNVAADLRALSDSLHYVALTKDAASFEALRPGMAFREDAMKRRFADIEALCGGERLVLMAHAFHLARDDAAIRLGADAVGPGAGLTCSVGHHLAQELGKRIVAVWFVYGGGEDSQPFPQLPRHARYPGHTLNAALAREGEGFFFPTDGLFGDWSSVGHMYNAIVPVRLGTLADAVFFLPRVTPLMRG